jgi:hypothetical protein
VAEEGVIVAVKVTLLPTNAELLDGTTVVVVEVNNSLQATASELALTVPSPVTSS